MSNPTKIIPMAKAEKKSEEDMAIQMQYDLMVHDTSILNENKEKIINWLLDHCGIYVKYVELARNNKGETCKRQIVFSIIDDRIYYVKEAFSNDIGIDLIENSTCSYLESLLSAVISVIINIATTRDPSIMMDCRNVSMIIGDVSDQLEKIRLKIEAVIDKKDIEYLIKNYIL